MPELLLNPLALRQTSLDLFNPPVALLRIIISRIHNNHFFGNVLEQTMRQIADVLLGNCNDDQLAVANSVFHGDRIRARLSSKSCQRFRSARVRDLDVMAELPESPRERPADVSCADDSDFHAGLDAAGGVKDPLKRR